MVLYATIGKYADGLDGDRPSNTPPTITLRCEARNKITLRPFQKDFRIARLALKPTLFLPF